MKIVNEFGRAPDWLDYVFWGWMTLTFPVWLPFYLVGWLGIRVLAFASSTWSDRT